MISSAEKYKKEDDLQKERINAKNQLESYCYSMTDLIDNGDAKLSSSDKKMIQKVCTSTLDWLNLNQSASREEFDYKRKKADCRG